MKDPKLFLVSAPSGAGKSSLIDAVLAKANQSHLLLELSVSYTTRSPRKGESNGNQYFFISEEEFIEKKNSNFFLEHAKVHDNWYGTSLDFVQLKLGSGVNLILEIDVQGFRQINDLSFSYDSIFILPPSML
jgi:guanylate kinase